MSIDRLDYKIKFRDPAQLKDRPGNPDRTAPSRSAPLLTRLTGSGSQTLSKKTAEDESIPALQDTVTSRFGDLWEIGGVHRLL